MLSVLQSLLVLKLLFVMVLLVVLSLPMLLKRFLLHAGVNGGFVAVTVEPVNLMQVMV